MANTAAASKVDVYDRITEQIVAQLEAGVVPWHQPWKSGDGLASLPKSMSTGKPYRGINTWLLWSEATFREFTSCWWGTYKQISELGGQVRKGERATHVILFRLYPCKTHGVEKCKECGGGAVAKSFPVFNASQADNLPEKYLAAPTVEREHSPIVEAERIVARYLADGPTLVVAGDRACYSPSLDTVRMPSAGVFVSDDHYYSTLFHELTHSTGHADRLARADLLEFHAFGDEAYSREELCAEMGAAFLSAVVGIEQTTIDASAAYLDHWLKVLKGDKKLIAKAAADAQRAVDFITGDITVDPVAV